jgi:DNA-nicking Smr family endonuclease
MGNNDLSLWHAYARTVKATPGKQRSPPSSEKPSQKTHEVKKNHPPVNSVRGKTARASELPSPTFERKREKALRAGEIKVDATLDLHGMTQNEAFGALIDFMGRSIRARKISLLIVTGKGRAGEGVLRKYLKDWLEQLPEAHRIMAFRPAGTKHGGDGAFYIFLKKNKNDL